MQRWLARELCFHRDPSLIRFYTGAGPRGTLDLSASRRHLAVETDGLSSGFAGISNSFKQGLSFASRDWLFDPAADPNMFQRYFDPKSSFSSLTDVSHGVDSDFTVLCWVYGDNPSTSGPLIGSQGRFTVSGSGFTTYPGLRGWTFGVESGLPYLEMYSHKLLALDSLLNFTSLADYGGLYISSSSGPKSLASNQRWNQVACVFRGSDIPWGFGYGGGATSDPIPGTPNEYHEGTGSLDVRRRQYIDFFYNGRCLGSNASSESWASLKQTTNLIPNITGTVYSSVGGDTYEATSDPLFSVGSQQSLNYRDVHDLTEYFDFCTGPGCLFRIYNRALSESEICNIYRREQFLLYCKPFQDWAADEASGLSCYLSGMDTTQLSMTLFADASIELDIPVPLYTYGSATITKGVTLYAGSATPEVNNLTLYCGGLGLQNAGIPLSALSFVEINNALDLYLSGFQSLSQSITLFTYGIFTATCGIPLFAAAEPIRSLQANVPLSLFGSINPGMSNGITLYAHVGLDGQTPLVRIPLFAKGADQGDATRLMNLVAFGCTHNIENSLDLFVCSNPPTAWSSRINQVNAHARRLNGSLMSATPLVAIDSHNQLTLFVRGDGVTDGAVPFANSLNLFLRRDPSAAVPLYVHAPGEQLEFGIGLYVAGVNTTLASLNLSIPGAIGLPTRPVKLYTTGF